jgi:hypothetical protein
MERCRHGPVPEFVVENKEHTAKCWLNDGSEESLIQLSRGPV